MITRNDVIMIYLTLQLLITSALYCKALQRAAYLQGRLDQQTDYISVDDLDGKGKCKP
jgi:hypothetical protein